MLQSWDCARLLPEPSLHLTAYPRRRRRRSLLKTLTESVVLPWVLFYFQSFVSSLHIQYFTSCSRFPAFCCRLLIESPVSRCQSRPWLHPPVSPSPLVQTALVCFCPRCSSVALRAVSQLSESASSEGLLFVSIISFLLVPLSPFWCCLFPPVWTPLIDFWLSKTKRAHLWQISLCYHFTIMLGF